MIICMHATVVTMADNMCTLINNLKAAQFCFCGQSTQLMRDGPCTACKCSYCACCIRWHVQLSTSQPMYLLWFEALYRRRRARAAGGSFADLQPAGHHRAYIIPPSLSSCTHSQDVAACSPWFVPAGSDCSDDQHNSHSSPGR